MTVVYASSPPTMFFASSSTTCTEGNWKKLPAGPLFRALRNKKMKKLGRMLKQKKWKQHVNDLDGDGCGLLHLFAMTDDKGTIEDARETVQIIQDAGGFINLLSGLQETPVLIAAYYGHFNALQALVEAGACPHAPNCRGKTPLMLARQSVKSKYHRVLGITEDSCLLTLGYLQRILEKENREI